MADQRGGAISTRRITVSTSGIIPMITELGQAEIRPRLAISLNASYEDQRRELMPITKKYHLADLIEACRAFPLRHKETITFEYVLLKGVNDTDEDARRVVNLLKKVEAKVNVIALNPGPGIPFEETRTGACVRVSRDHSPVDSVLPAEAARARHLLPHAAQLKRMEEGPFPVGRVSRYLARTPGISNFWALPSEKSASENVASETDFNTSFRVALPFAKCTVCTGNTVNSGLADARVRNQRRMFWGKLARPEFSSFIFSKTWKSLALNFKSAGWAAQISLTFIASFVPS